uniref:Neur_chan_LBD domain-containing protein n=1 Tax=Rhabditophanes sp. KR3021 TaxID=114890 RepID=A0AC35U7G0_9BILA
MKRSFLSTDNWLSSKYTKWVPYFFILYQLFSITKIEGGRSALLQADGQFLPHVRLAKDLLDKKRYDNRIRPVVNQSQPTKVNFTMSLYQILAINDKQQSLDLNVWVIQKWNDEFLGWNPHKYGMINSTILPYNSIWLPDTYVYNSVIMNREETERYINVVVDTNYYKRERGSEITLMYPSLYRTSCRLNILYFPYDQQNCTIIISSWTSDKASIDYYPDLPNVNLANYIPNEEWIVVSFTVHRVEKKFVCCPDPWVLLECNLVIRRKPLYYIVNLVVPTSVITLVAVTGFFTPASTSNERREKLSLGIDSLLAMSILMMMVSEQMPTTSDYVPLFGLFYLAIIIIIFIGTIFTAFILNIHLQKAFSRPISPLVAYIFFHKVAIWLKLKPSANLRELWNDTGALYGTDMMSVRKKSAYMMSKRSLKKREGNPISKAIKLENGSKICKLNDLSTANLINNYQSYLPNIDDPLSSGNNTQRSIIFDGNGKGASTSAKANWRRLASKITNRGSDLEINGSKVKIPLTEMNIGGSFRNSQLPCIASLVTDSAFTTRSQAAEIEAIDLKLRRRYALEWEYLAGILDRLLLIIFSILVAVVTLLMVGVGEAIHLSYSYEDANNDDGVVV